MFRFTIRDMLWLTMVAAVGLALWLGWSREIGMLRDESVAREAKLRDQVVSEHDLGKKKMTDLMKAYSQLSVERLKQEAIRNRIQETSSNRKSEIIRLEDEVCRLKAEIAGRSQAISATTSD